MGNSRDSVLCLVNGPWQAISLAASLSQLEVGPTTHDIDVVLVDMLAESALHAATRRVLTANGLDRLHTLSKSTTIHGLPARFAALQRELGISADQVDLIATYGVHRPVGRFFVNSMPQARVLIYEEGLRSYLPRSTTLRSQATSQFARLWGRLDPAFGSAWSPPRESERAWAYCFLLADQLPLPDFAASEHSHRIARRHLADALAATPAPPVRELPAQPFVVIVGQYYARLAQMSAPAEIAAYAEAARAIEARGCLPIWRGHIREHDELFEALKDRCPSVRNFSEFVHDAALPLELHARLFAGPHCKGAISFSSSSLFYLRALYDLPVHTLVNPHMLGPMNHPHLDACKLAQAHLPAFSAWELA